MLRFTGDEYGITCITLKDSEKGKKIHVHLDEDSFLDRIYETEQEKIQHPVDQTVFKSLSRKMHPGHCDQCSICFEKLTTTNSVVDPQTTVELPCGHVFHQSCIKNWFNTKSTCPICRHELKSSIKIHFLLNKKMYLERYFHPYTSVYELLVYIKSKFYLDIDLEKYADMKSQSLEDKKIYHNSVIEILKKKPVGQTVLPN